jgi:hypothetical protein
MAHYQIGSYSFELHINCQNQCPAHDFQLALDLVLRNFRTSNLKPSKNTQQNMIQTPAGTICCYVDQGVNHIEITPDTAIDADALSLVDLFEPDIVNLAIQESSGHLWIHGACLVRRGERILLVAESGTGKTTLSLGLLAHGYRLITDDIFLIELEGRAIIPVPRCPKIRPTAAEFLRGADFDLAQRARLIGRYVALSHDHLQLTPLPLPIHRVYSLQRDPSVPGTCHEVDTISGLLSLVPRSNLLGLDSSLELASDLFRETRFFSMNLNDYPHDLATIALGY